MAVADPYVPAAIGLAGVLVGAVTNGFFNRREAQRKERQALRSAARLLTEDLAEAFDELRQHDSGAVFLINEHEAVDKVLASWNETSAIIAGGSSASEWSRIRIGFRLLRDIRDDAGGDARQARAMRTDEDASYETHYLEAAASAMDRLALMGDKRSERWSFQIKRSIETLLLRTEADPRYSTSQYVTPWIRSAGTARQQSDETAGLASHPERARDESH